MIHRIRDELLAILHLPQRFLGKPKIDIHVIHKAGSVYRYFVLRKLLWIIELRPVLVLGKDACHLAQLLKLWIGLEHEWEYHLAREVNGLPLRDSILRVSAIDPVEIRK